MYLGTHLASKEHVAVKKKSKQRKKLIFFWSIIFCGRKSKAMTYSSAVINFTLICAYVCMHVSRANFNRFSPKRSSYHNRSLSALLRQKKDKLTVF